MIHREAWYKEAGELLTFYHVTSASKVPRILEEGLVPKIGERSQDIGEKSSAVYLFKSVDAAEDAVSNWLGDRYDETEPLVLLEVLVEPQSLSVNTLDDMTAFEVQTSSKVPPENIRILRRSM